MFLIASPTCFSALSEAFFSVSAAFLASPDGEPG